jgi:transcriptional regulator with XRE-family HTH domain
VDEAEARRRWGSLVVKLRQARQTSPGTPMRGLAQRLGVTPGTMLDWEIGEVVPSVRNTIRWAQMLGLRLAVIDGQGRRCAVPVRVALGEGFEDREFRRLAYTLRDQRLARNVSPEAVSGEMGVAWKSVLLWEYAHERRPGLVTLMAWAGALDCRVILVADDAGYPTAIL